MVREIRNTRIAPAKTAQKPRVMSVLFKRVRKAIASSTGFSTVSVSCGEAPGVRFTELAKKVLPAI